MLKGRKVDTIQIFQVITTLYINYISIKNKTEKKKNPKNIPGKTENVPTSWEIVYQCILRILVVIIYLKLLILTLLYN